MELETFLGGILGVGCGGETRDALKANEQHNRCAEKLINI